MPRRKQAPYKSDSYQVIKRGGSRHVTRRTIDGISVPAFGTRPFAGIDGEGGNRILEDGSKHHEYKLLRAGEHELLNSDGRALTSLQCLDFVADLPPDKIYVGFFFDYDVTMMLRDLPQERLVRLYDRESRAMRNGTAACFPLDYGPFQLDYMQGKEFKVRRAGTANWTIISDIGSFFQCTFVKALSQWFTEPEYLRVIEKISEGKDQRAEFEELTDYTRQYCKLETDMAALLMERFRDMCNKINVRPAKWQGPGNLVSAVMKREGFPRNKDIPMWTDPVGKHAMGMANAAYYGGRFEAGIVGSIKGPIYQYDINSAYPSVFKLLPCLIHGEWHPINGDSLRHIGTDNLWIGRIGFLHKPNVFYCGFPVRCKDGTIVFPRQGKGIYWSHEIEAALPYLTDWHLSNGFLYEKKCECSPFDWVYAIYEERKRVGKSGRGIPLKLILNSTYGKLCQSIGSAPYANPVWASLITSYVRSYLYRASMASADQSNPGLGTIMLATDGIFTLDERTLPIGTSLGEWERTVHDEMFVVQSGLYFLPNQMPKTRGTPARKIAAMESQFRDGWNSYVREIGKWDGPDAYSDCDISVPVTNFTSMALALARNNLSSAGQWIDTTKRVSFDWRNKRTIHSPPVLHESELITIPRDGGIDFDNYPYSKRIGATSAPELEGTGQPDWNFGPFSS